MNCANHVDVPAVAYCRTCGKPLCSNCARDVRGVIYCEECLASHLSGTMPPPGSTAVPPGVSPPTGLPRPGVAAVLGLIPGVGAMYNGEFAKGFIHVLIFATLIWLTNPDHGSGLFGIAIAAFYIYMPIEAYKTAQAREMGLPAPDPFGFNHLFSSGFGTHRPVRGAPANPAASAGNVMSVGDAAPLVPPQAEPPMDEPRSHVPVGAFILIGLGVLFLLDELGALHFDWIWRFWPLILIAIGVRVLMQRQRRGW
jgi:TM2 domain-containing membrane protein YozV